MPHHQNKLKTGWVPQRPIRGRHPKNEKLTLGLKIVPPSPHLFLREVPIGSPGAVKVFLNRCVLMSTMIGYYMVRQHEDHKGISHKDLDNIIAIKNFYISPSKESVKKLNLAGAQLLKEVLHVEEKCPDIVGKTSHEEICPLLALHYTCQINVIDSNDPRALLALYPPEWDQSLPQVWLFLQRQDGDVDHMIVIKSISAFRSYYGGKQCQACGTVHAGASQKHFCRSVLRRTCRFCQRPIQQPNTYINKKNVDSICLRPTTIKMTPCANCNVTPANEECEKKHKCLGFFCQKCKQFKYKSGRLKTVEMCRKCHKCNRKTCTFCLEDYATKTIHHCELTRPSYLKKIPNIGFLCIEQYDNRECNCDQCSEGLLCEDHTMQHDLFPPIMVTLLAEHGQRGQFKQFRWYSDDLKCVDDVPKDNHFKYEFSQKNLQESPLSFEPNKRNFGQPKSKKIPSRLSFLKRDIKTLNATGKALYTILSNSQFENMTILTLGHKPLVKLLTTVNSIVLKIISSVLLSGGHASKPGGQWHASFCI